MENALMEMINVVLSSEEIRPPTAAMINLYNSPENLPCLVHIAKTNAEKNIRRCATLILIERLRELRHWLEVPSEHKATILRDMPQALITEEEQDVTEVLAQFVAILVTHEADKAETWMSEVFSHIFERCCSANPEESERGSSTYAVLAAAAPDQFSVHTETICTLLANILLAAEARGDLSTPTVANMIAGTNNLLLCRAKNTATEQKFTQVLPLVLRAIDAIAMKGDFDMYLEVLNMLDSVTAYFSHIPNIMWLVLDFCLNTATNREIVDKFRVPMIAFIGCIVSNSKKAIVEQNFLERILSVVLDIMSTNYPSLKNGADHPLTLACQTLTSLAIHMPPGTLIPTLLQLQVPARGNPDPLRRGAVVFALALIAESCSETIRHKYLNDMMEELNRGFADSAIEVHSYAFLALCNFSLYLQPEISEFAPVIAPMFFETLHKLVEDLQADESDPACCNLLFTAMNTFWDQLEENLAPYLPSLMECLFEFLDPRFSVQIWELALSSVSSVSIAVKEHLVPYLQRIIDILMTFLVKDVPEEVASLRLQAIDTLGMIIRFTPKEHILPLANEAKIYCLMMVEEGPGNLDFRLGIFKLLGALSCVMNESMAEVFPQVMTLIIQTVFFAGDVAVSLRNQIDRDLIQNASSADEDSNRESEDKDEVDLYYQQLSTYYLVEKHAAIFALRDFAVNTGTAFIPYLQLAFEKVYMMLSHGNNEIRTASSVTLCEFVAALNRSGDTVGVTRLCESLIPKLAEMMRSEKDKKALSYLLYEVGRLLWANGQSALPNQDCAELINACIRDTFLGNMTCQLKDRNGDGDEDHEEEESELDNTVVEMAGNLLASFGCALDPQTFSLYFGQLFCFLIQRLDKAKKDDKPKRRAFIYSTLSESFLSLKSCSATYFDTFCPLFLEGTKDTDSTPREESFFALGELVAYSGEKSFEAYPMILQALSDAMATETAPAVMDNICGAVARLILTNVQAVPLAAVLPVLMSHLPLRENFTEYLAVLKMFHLLSTQAAPSTVDHIERMLYISIKGLHQKQITDQVTKLYAKEFINLVYTDYPDKFNNLSPEILQCVQTL